MIKKLFNLFIFLFSAFVLPTFAQDAYPGEVIKRNIGSPVGVGGKSFSDVDISSLTNPNFFPFQNATKALLGLKPDRGSGSRNLNNARLYQKTSPAVVLIASKNSLGSGALIDRNGLVITNWHVVSDSKEVAVIFKPEREGEKPSKADIRSASVVKYDEVTDLALLKISQIPSRINPLRLGDISDVAVGLDVHAIGHPNGEAWTYTKGIISQFRQGYTWSSKSAQKKHKANVIQTQTPINPGNSGGPLLIDNGLLVGVNSFKSIDSEGQNFAVSVDEIKNFLARTVNRSAEKITPECKLKEIYRGENTEKTATVIGYDIDCDGIADAELLSPYDQSRPVLLSYDRNNDRLPDVIFFDMERKGKWKFSFWDNDYDGKWDLIGFHDDGTLTVSRYETFSDVASRANK